jgi:hypothetical protein
MILYDWQIGKETFKAIQTGDYRENHPAVPTRIWRRLTKLDHFRLEISDTYTATRPRSKIWSYEELLNVKRN